MANNPTIQKPTKVQRSQEHLDAAITRLERALKAKSRKQSPSSDDAQVVQLREENAQLAEVNEQIAVRLDSAILRLRAAIGD